MPNEPHEGLIVEQSGALGRPVEQFINPALLYIASLMEGQSRQTGIECLKRLTKILRWDDWRTAPWWKLSATETSYIHAAITQSYGPNTSRLTIHGLKGVLKQAFRVGLMSADAYHRAILLPSIKCQTAPAGRMLTEVEVEQLAKHIGKLASPRGPLAEAIFAVGLGGGLRREEIAVLRTTSLAPDNIHLLVLGKGRKERVQALPQWAGSAVRRWMTVRETLKLASHFMFVQVSPTGQVRDSGLSKLGVWRLINSLMKTSATVHFTPHDLRRTFASRMLDRTDLVSVQKLMGHSDVSTTARYDRRGTRVAEKAVSGLEAWGFSETIEEPPVKKTITIPPPASKGLATIGEALRAKPTLSAIVPAPAVVSPPPEVEKSNVISMIDHPVTGQRLVSRRVVAKPDYLRNGKPLDLAWVRRQCRALATREVLPMKIVEVLSKAGVRRADGRTVRIDDVARWSTTAP